ncbi:MAG TPA: hypothetical protein VFK80_05140, partial [Limnochordia bacterium]|nr:hypothetical protein [Limnochordia bacterium]
MSGGGGRHDSLWAQMVQADAAYGPIAFWFWNDALDEAELLRQLHCYHQDGYGGVIIHPRVGLAAEIGYLTPQYFALVRRVVAECAVLGLKVILYDEGSYPSGAACGQVVAENPDFAARALTLVHKPVQGPWQGYWRPSAGRSLLNRLVAVVLGQERDGRIDPASLRLLEPGEHGLVRVQVDAGEWRLCACFDVPSGGHIRGVLPEHEDGSALAPAAADLMNPAAVAAFIRLTHDAYAHHIGEFFGSTVVALFTDEPNPLGRGSRRGVKPYTPGVERMLDGRPEAETKAWLPALWLDYGLETEAFRAAYARGIHARVRAVFYGAQAAWCRRHGLALTGHPSGSNDMASLGDFDWPGQDMVWRWVTPGNESGIAGEHSVAPLAATSAARAWGRRRIATEVFGAYGWRLSLDEAKWLLDWHFARGNNLIIPHALFYSVRAGRAYES